MVNTVYQSKHWHTVFFNFRINKTVKTGEKLKKTEKLK